MKAPKFTTQIFLGMLLGVIVGHFWGQDASSLDVLSTIFLRLIKMVISPLVFSAIVVGIAKVGDFKAVGRIGVKLFYIFRQQQLLRFYQGFCLLIWHSPEKICASNCPHMGQMLAFRPLVIRI